MIEQRAGRRLAFAIVGNTHLAHGDGARGEVEQNGGRIAARQANGERIGAEAPLRTAMRCNQRTAYDVRKVDRGQAGGDCLLCPVTHASEMMRIAQPDNDDAVLPRPLDGKLHGLIRDRLAHAAIAVDNEERIGVRDDGDALIELELISQQ